MFRKQWEADIQTKKANFKPTGDKVSARESARADLPVKAFKKKAAAVKPTSRPLYTDSD
jgi:hypothetical protein